MPNPHRGEIEASLDGKSFRLCLTLSALAELEHAFNNEDMLALAERFQSGRLSVVCRLGRVSAMTQHKAASAIALGLRFA